LFGVCAPSSSTAADWQAGTAKANITPERFMAM
jgi:hypothetical protein